MSEMGRGEKEEEEGNVIQSGYINLFFTGSAEQFDEGGQEETTQRQVNEREGRCHSGIVSIFFAFIFFSFFFLSPLV